MPAGPVGSCWRAGSWRDTAWQAGAWVGNTTSVLLDLCEASTRRLVAVRGDRALTPVRTVDGLGPVRGTKVWCP